MLVVFVCLFDCCLVCWCLGYLWLIVLIDVGDVWMLFGLILVVIALEVGLG